MVSVSNVSGGQASKYYEKDDYYLRESIGEWQGELKEHYQLPDEITKKDFDRFIKLKDKRAGTDLTFSMPKSCSIVMNLNDQFHSQILDSHKKVVSDTLNYIEKNYMQYREQKDYVEKYHRGDKMLVAKFDHFVNRLQEPHTHTHCVILNQTQRKDGKIRANNNELIFKNQLQIGQMYRNHLAHELTKRGIALEITDRKNGFFEIKGITREQIEKFSTRRQEILDLLKQKNWDLKNAKAREQATLLTREAKTKKDLSLLQQSWRMDFKNFHIKESKIKKSASSQISNLEKRLFFSGIDQKISDQTLAFSRAEYSNIALKEGLGKGITQDDIEAYLDHCLKKGDMIEASIKTEPINKKRVVTFKEEQYLATKESIKLENGIYDQVMAGKNKSAGISKYLVQKHLKNQERNNINLTPGQKSSIEHLTTSKDRYSAIQGYAGTGKTFMLNEVRQVYERYDYEVKGMAFTGKAAEGLQKEAKIDSGTIHSVLNRLEKEAGNRNASEDLENKKDWNLEGLKKGSKEVWIIDECSMVDNKLMAKVQEAAELKNARVHFIGDRRQLQAIGAGNSFSNMIKENKIDYSEMKEIIRQKEQWKVYKSDTLSKDDLKTLEKEVTKNNASLKLYRSDSPKNLKQNDYYKIEMVQIKENRFVEVHKDSHIQKAVRDAAKGRIEQSLKKLEPNTMQIKSNNKRLDRIAIDYSIQNKGDRKNSFILTGSNKDRIYINNQVRENLKASGQIENKGTQLEVKNINGKKEILEFSRGDRIMFLKNDKQNLHVLNGSKGDITAIHGDQLRVRLDNNREISFKSREYNHLTHAYASTSFKAQGETTNRAFININTNQRKLNNQNKMYVDVSRVKHDLKIYTNDKPGLARAVSREQIKITASQFQKNINKPNIQREQKNTNIKNQLVETKSDQLQNQFKKLELSTNSITSNFKEKLKFQENPKTKNSLNLDPKFQEKPLKEKIKIKKTPELTHKISKGIALGR